LTIVSLFVCSLIFLIASFALFSSLQARINTLGESLANSKAVSYPIPVLEPVTIIILFFRFGKYLLLLPLKYFFNIIKSKEKAIAIVT